MEIIIRKSLVQLGKEQNMKKSKVFLGIGCIMILIATMFIMFAMNHPEMSFIGGNAVAYVAYTTYILIVVVMFIMAKKAK